MLKHGNTVGSRAIKLQYSARKHLVLQLSQRQMSIVLGSILGDAYIYPQGKICLEHSVTQKDYLLWKYTELKSIAYPKVSKVIRRDKRTDTTTVSQRFFLRQYFKPLRKTFYNGNQKVISSEIRNWFTPLLLAVWYMDDGYLDRGKYPQLMTESFVVKDLVFLQQLLEENYNLQTKVTAKKRIVILGQSSENFFQLIRPYIHPSLKYKLP
jgi:hypothetical protein